MNTSQSKLISRRTTLKGLAAGIVAPTIIPSSALGGAGKPSANDRIRVGTIGVGFRATLLMDQLPEEAEIVALSDCDLPRAEAYRSGDEPMNVDVAFVDGKRIINAADFQLLQNNPNPFATTTNIGFVLPSAGEATLSILDVTGKVIKVYSNEYTKGYHQIQVSRKELPASGVLYYKLESQDYTATRKMVLVD